MGHPLCLTVFLFLFLFQSGAPLIARFEEIARKARGRVGVAVEVIGKGGSVGIRTGERFPMASVFKLPIGMAVLHKVGQSKLSLDQKILVKKSDFVAPGSYSAIRDQHPEGGFEMTVRELLRVMMDVSDGTACDVLLRLAGGPSAVTEYMRSLGVREVVVATFQKEMFGRPDLQTRNWATPRGVLGLLRALQQDASISRPGRELLLKFMAESRTGPQRIKGLLPPGTVVSHKTGSLGARATNDVGIVTLPDGRPMAVAVFVAESRADEAVRERVIAEIARVAWEHFGGK